MEDRVRATEPRRNLTITAEHAEPARVQNDSTRRREAAIQAANRKIPNRTQWQEVRISRIAACSLGLLCRPTAGSVSLWPILFVTIAVS
jgi:hypothetical protein